MQNYNSQPSKRRRLSHTDEIVNMLGPSRNRASAILPRRCPPKPELDIVNRQPDKSDPSSRNENENNVDAATAAPLPKLVDSPLTSQNIELALCMIERNTKQKRNSFKHLLQAFHDLYRWSRLSNRDHRDFFLNEFVMELSGISRVKKFQKVYNMGDAFLCQLLQTETPFNE